VSWVLDSKPVAVPPMVYAGVAEVNGGVTSKEVDVALSLLQPVSAIVVNARVSAGINNRFLAFIMILCFLYQLVILLSAAAARARIGSEALWNE
jgi:hypothetical protein